MESPMSESFSFPGNRLLSYLRSLESSKKGLPHGIPVCVCHSHTITTTEALVQLASDIGPNIAMLMVIADIIDDWSDESVRQLLALARQHSFLIWEGGRILNSTVDVTAKRNSESKEARNELVDLVRKKYTKGVIRPATWAGVSTAWASGVAEDNQEADILIPALKTAARETVANTMQTIRTEITAEKTHSSTTGAGSHLKDEGDDAHQHLSSDYVMVDDDSGLGPPQRKASTISLTHTITQHTEDSAEVSSIKSADRTEANGTGNGSSSNPNYNDEHLSVEGLQKRPSITPEDADVPPPPLLARGLVLCLPSENTDAFTPTYRRSCVAAARANQDFVIGFLSSGQWHVESQRDDFFAFESDDRPIDANHLNEWDEDKPYHLAMFSLVSHRLGHMHGKHLSDYGTEDSHDEPVSPTTAAAPVVSASSADEAFNPMASKLNEILGRALKFREATANSNASGQPAANKTKNNPRVIHVPIVSLP